MKPAATITIAALAATLVLGAAPAQNEKQRNLKAAPVQSATINVGSSYQLVPFSIGGVTVHSIGIKGNLTGEAQLYLDPNACSLNDFADPVLCTKAWVAPQRITFQKVEIKDPLQQGRSLFELQGLRSNNKTYVVVPRDQAGLYLLIQKNPAGQYITLLALTRISS